MTMENCVLQCETTGVIVRTSAHLTMNRCDLYGSKGAGVEIYPGSVCSLVGNGIHHCKDGILIKDFADELDVMPSITMEDNVIHNNEGYGVILVTPNNGKQHRSEDDPAGLTAAEDKQQESFPDPLLLLSSASASNPSSSSSADVQPEVAENNNGPDGSVASTSGPDGSVASTSGPDGSVASTSGPDGSVASTSGPDGSVASTSGRKWQFSRQLSRTKETSCSRAAQDLMEHQIFVSIQGNQFRRNGMGDFGTFLY